MLWMALAVMTGATLAQHLGLTEAIVRILLKVARCPKCCSFWSVLLTLLVTGCNPVLAAILSLACAYMSQWLGIVLYALYLIYEKIWQGIQRRGR